MHMTDVLPVGASSAAPGSALTAALRQRQSTPKLVADEILGWIERGEYKPSDPLPSERDLQQRFGVSRVVVRDALVRLQAVGLVTVEHGRGCYVSDALVDWSSGPFRVWMDTHQLEIINLLKLRRALDGLAAEEMASTHDAAAMKIVADAEQAFADEIGGEADSVRLASLDKDFHVAIADASGMTIIAQLLHELDGHAANLHRTTMGIEGRPQQSLNDHRSIVTALRSHDAAAARRAAEAHVDGSIDQVQAIIDRRGERTAG